MNLPDFPNNIEESVPRGEPNAATEGIDEISLCDENEVEADEEEIDDNVGVDENEVGGCNFSLETAVNNLDDLGKFNLQALSPEDVMKFHFPGLDVAFLFYNWYAGMNGFAARKSKVMRNCLGEITQQTFVCHREGHRKVTNKTELNRSRDSKPKSRCGCEARCMVHIEAKSGRWYIKYVNDVHNHTFVEPMYRGMLPAHRRMTDYDKFQMNSMVKVGISTPHVFGLLADQAGGYENVGFLKRDMYNEQVRQRRIHFSDAKAALDLLEEMQSKDDMFFWRHSVDDDDRLENLFWCDSVGRRYFSVFGDVLAFDATYRKNKYLCPLVVFSGVNHHIQSIVFAGAIVGDETEETYVWLLEQFLEAMGGKSPGSVITDGDLAMRNAIRRVFPNAHHRLCAWHLIRNATSNVKNPQFVSKFKQCMLGDYDVAEFELKWQSMVDEFGLHENSWVTDMYEKRRMWATAHIRGNFFAGFRTTSRCEGLNSEFGKYVNFQNNLLDFLQHFFRWLNYMRYREVEADFSSSYGEPVLRTPLQLLETSASNLYTREVFKVFRPVLERACQCIVVGIRQTASSFFYKVCKYRKDDVDWLVSYCPSSLEFKCSCLRMESMGIPCEHLLSVMVSLSIAQLPQCVVLSRWTKAAKDSIGLLNNNTFRSKDPALISQYVFLVERCKRMANAALDCGLTEYMRKTVAMVDAHTVYLESVAKGEETVTVDHVQCSNGNVRNPVRVRTKGCGGATTSVNDKGKKIVRRTQTCGMCGEKGHNRTSCPVSRAEDHLSQTRPNSTVGYIDDDDMDDGYYFAETKIKVICYVVLTKDSVQ